MPARPSSTRIVAPLAATAAAVIIALVVWLAARTNPGSIAVAGGTPSVGTTVVEPSSVAPSSGPSASLTATPSPAGPAAICTGTQLVAAVGRAGPAGGTENIFVLLHNTSQRGCHLGGILPLTGVRTDGTTARLPFAGSTDPGIADPGPVQGPGTVAPNGYGAFHVTVGLNCTPSAGSFAKLRIGLGSAQYVEMAYPAEFLLGCPGYEAQAGPVVSPAALSGQ